MVRLTDRPDMTLDVYRGRKTTIQQQQQQMYCWSACTGNNPLAEARGLSPHTGGQTMVQLIHSIIFFLFRASLFDLP